MSKPIYKLFDTLLRKVMRDEIIPSDLLRFYRDLSCKYREGDTSALISILVNGILEGTILDDTIEIVITDGVNPVTPNSVGIVGRTVTVEVASGGGSFNVGSVDRFGNTLPNIVVSADTTLNWEAYDFAQQYINALSFTPSATLEGAIIDLVDDLIGFGIWSKMRAMWLLNMGTAIDTALNLKYPFANKNSFQLTHFGSPTYNSDGIQYNTSTNHTYTHFDPAMIGNDNYHFGIYSQTNSLPTGTAIDIGLTGLGTFTGIFIRDNNTNRTALQLNGSSFATNTNPSSDGHYIANASGTSGKLVKNGSTALYNETILNNTTFACISINGRTINTIGATEFKTGRKYSFAHVGEALTDTEIANLYTAIQTYHTTLGIQK